MASIIGKHETLEDSMDDGVSARRDVVRSIETRGRHTQLVLLCGVAIIVVFIVGSIYIQGQKYPHHVAWWERAKQQSTKGESYGIYQVITASRYPPIQYAMNGITAWRNLDSKGAEFLLMCIQWFEVDNPKTRGRLTMRHWAGTAGETGATNLFSPPGKGWASVCAADNSNDEERKRSFASNWKGSASQNLWEAFFPDPSDPNFFTIGMFQQLLEYQACDESASNATYLDIYQLFDGGLCNIAFKYTATDQTASELFENFFGLQVKLKPQCGAATAEAAFEGTVGMATAALPLMANTAANPMLIPALVAGVSVAGGVAGGVIGGLSANEACQSV